MPTSITIEIGEIALKGELNDSATARALAAKLPTTVAMSRWGDEYYGACGLNADLEQDARDEMDVGELAYWPAGDALCIFFGPTPASRGNEPRAASDVNVLGRLTDDTAPLRPLGGSITATVQPAG